MTPRGLVDVAVVALGALAFASAIDLLVRASRSETAGRKRHAT